MAFKKLAQMFNTKEQNQEDTPLSVAEETPQEDITEPATPAAPCHIDPALTESHMLRPTGDGYLAGQLLVATPLIHDSIFHQSVVYLFNHNAEGAMGCIINQPIEMVDFSALLEQVNITVEGELARDIPVLFGGPVERHRGFVVHTNEKPMTEALSVHNGIAVTAVSSILKDIALGTGPRNASLVVGYAGWTAGQLEKEIEENSWITVPANEKLLFETPDDLKWSVASQQLGIDMNFFSHTVGHA